MTCRECSEFLSAYIEGDLEVEVRAIFERHLSLCPNCVTYVEQFRATVLACHAAYGDDAEADVPEELIQAILASRKA